MTHCGVELDQEGAAQGTGVADLRAIAVAGPIKGATPQASNHVGCQRAAVYDGLGVGVKRGFVWVRISNGELRVEGLSGDRGISNKEAVGALAAGAGV